MSSPTTTLVELWECVPRSQNCKETATARCPLIRNARTEPLEWAVVNIPYNRLFHSCLNSTSRSPKLEPIRSSSAARFREGLILHPFYRVRRRKGMINIYVVNPFAHLLKGMVI